MNGLDSRMCIWRSTQCLYPRTSTWFNG